MTVTAPSVAFDPTVLVPSNPSWLYSFASNLSIQTKDVEVVKFFPNWAQMELFAEIERQESTRRPVRIIILKARQIGASTAVRAVNFDHHWRYPRARSICIADENDTSEHLLSIDKLFWETWAFRPLFHIKYDARDEMTWLETGSSVKIGTARNPRFGRGRTISFLHGSEVAFWDKPKKLMTGLRQAIPNRPGTYIFLESTANGVGNYFHSTWNAAVSGDVEYAPLFFTWWKHYEYCATFAGITGTLTKLTEDERLLNALGVSDDHLLWRRWAIANLLNGDEEMFHQEYPSTPEEAFIASGTNVFPEDELKVCYAPEPGAVVRMEHTGGGMIPVSDRFGPIHIYRRPGDRRRTDYIVAGDPKRDVKRGDFAAIQVLNRATYEQVAVWHGRIHPYRLASELAKLGYYYNTALVTVETNGPGQTTIGALLEMGYPRIARVSWPDKAQGKVPESFGWDSSHKRKEQAIGFLLKLIYDHDLVLHHDLTFAELRDYVKIESGIGYGPSSEEGFDDLVSSLYIAVTAAHMEGPPVLELPSPRSREPVWTQWSDGQSVDLGDISNLAVDGPRLTMIPSSEVEGWTT